MKNRMIQVNGYDSSRDPVECEFVLLLEKRCDLNGNEYQACLWRLPNGRTFQGVINEGKEVSA